MAIVFDEVEGVIEPSSELSRARTPRAAEPSGTGADQVAKVLCELEAKERRKARLRAD